MTYEMNGILWTVRTVNSNSPLLMRSNNTMTVGMCDRSTHEICISDKLQGAFLRKVLIHEVCHSAMMSYGIDMSVEQEELFCGLVATYGDEIFDVVDNLFMVLRRIA
ncbi:MAG: SprT-like domain-containing protein [Lachnospiraceae bacterium]|nr:SprT-like domain-containing protein [Lachnospiraceae bacterium]